MSSNSDVISAAFPSQSDTNTLSFNAQIQDHLQSEFPFVTFLNQWNLTHKLTHLNHSCDGFHQISDGNLIKIMHVLQLMKLSLNGTNAINV